MKCEFDKDMHKLYIYNTCIFSYHLFHFLSYFVKLLFYQLRENLDGDQESESAAISDHHSYDADGSEESEENQESNEESKSRSLNTLQGSTESLYYSAWTLNESSQAEASQSGKENPKPDALADSFFTSGLPEPSLSESCEAAEEFHECDQPKERLYQHFNPRLSWSAGFGGHLAAIWGEKGFQETEVRVLSLCYL